MNTQGRANIVSAPDATHRVSQELSKLADRIASVELGVIDLCDIAGPVAVKATAPALQELDMILQYTNALSDYVQDLSELFPPDTNVDLASAIHRIPLRDLADGLSNRTPSPNADTGEPELF